jgi:hypothetical protein
MQIPETISRAKTLRQIAAALRAYHDTHGAFPPYANRAPDGRPLLSWRVLILPHFGRDEAALFKEFKLDEPWDSPHNSGLLSRMPAVFAPPAETTPTTTTTTTTATSPTFDSAQGPHLTHYRVVTGPGTVFEEGKRVSLADIKDGLDRTVLVVEAADAVAWTRPEAFVFVPGRPAPLLGVLREHFLVAYCDGKVGIHSNALPAADVAALLTVAGGESNNPVARRDGRNGSGWDWD